MNASPQQNVKLLREAKPPVENWPELITLDAPPLDPIDLNLLPLWARDFAVALAAHTETPPELAFGMVLGAYSAAVSRRCRVQVKPGYFEPCNLWLMVALASGNRKSSVQKAATAPLLDWENDQAADLKDEIKIKTSETRNIQSRIKHLRAKYARTEDEDEGKRIKEEIINLEVEMPDIPVPPRIWTSDATAEALGGLIEAGEESIAWLSSEGGIFDLLQGRYSKGNLNLDLILKCHSGDADLADRISRPGVTVKNPHITICLSPQVHVLEGLAAIPGFAGRGLLARFLPLLPESPLGKRTLETTDIPKEVRDKYKNSIHAILNWPAPDPTPDDSNGFYDIKLTEAAYEELHKFAKEIEQEMWNIDEKDPFLAWLSKSQYGTPARIAGVLHCIKHAFENAWEKDITIETMKNALDITATLIDHAEVAMNIMVADQEIVLARTLVDWIKQKNFPEFKAREAQRALSSHFPKKDMLDGPLRILEDCGYIKEISPQPQGTRGRPPAPSIRVNPKLLDPSPDKDDI